MGFCYEHVVRPFFFRMDPEHAHEVAARGLRLLSGLGPLCRMMARANATRRGGVDLFGLHFPNAVGLAAGFDKNASFWKGALALGFGHVEIGTVTYQRQPGNPRPRVFRFPEEQALINRMGFNNDGADQVARRLQRQLRGGRPPGPLGVNIGKSKAASLEHAAEDYLKSFAALADHADYFTINVSSPNTPDLRKLQEESRLLSLLEQLRKANVERAQRLGVKPLPMLVKIAPDLSFQQIDGVIEAIFAHGFDGIIATNTTLARPGAFASVQQEGGLSGMPLRRRSTEIITYIHKVTNGRLPIVAAGGICDVAAASEKMDAGAALVQIYTGMVYLGPFFAREVARGLAARRSDWWN